MIKTGDKLRCCGCSACSSICNHGAITMKSDVLGFYYPEIDKSQCVECGLCESVCCFQGKQKLEGFPLRSYAVRHIDIKEVTTSRSGAAFIALSDYILEQGGVVYGAGYGLHFVVKHKRAENALERNEFKGSKYAQSSLVEIYDSIKEDLKSGRVVLFSGTPCQTASVQQYMPAKLRDNLFLIDIICHGVSSPAVWDDYLSYLEAKFKTYIVAVNFRDKDVFGWSGLHKESFVFADGTKRTFQYTYYNDLLIRPSCNVCPYANLHRPSDITIGDFWGWEKVCPTMNMDDKGCSLLLINSEKGTGLFEHVTHNLHVLEVPIGQCMQPNMVRPTPEHEKRAQFESDYMSYGFKYVMSKYGEVGLKYHCLRIIRFVKRQIKKIFQ